jgi:hypothetical protein
MILRRSFPEDSLRTQALVNFLAVKIAFALDVDGHGVVEQAIDGGASYDLVVEPLVGL